MYRPKYSNRPTTKYLTTETKILEWRLFMYHLCTTATFQTIYHKRKILDIRLNIKDFSSVGVTGFEPATTRPEEVIRPHELRIVPDREEQAAQQQRHDTPAQFAAAPHPVAFGTDRNRKTRGATPAQPLAAIRALGDRIVVGMIVTVHNRSFTVVCSDRHDPRTTSARLSETIVFRGRRHHAPYPAARKRIVQN